MSAIVKPIPKSTSERGLLKDGAAELTTRYSRELVIALSGPVGCGLNTVRDVLVNKLRAHQYQVVHIKITERLPALAVALGIDSVKEKFSGEFDRITELQNLGNRLRTELGNDVGAQVAIEVIAADRSDRHPGVDVAKIVPGRVAYIVDQLKNPAEAKLLRDVYGRLFFLVGVLAGYERQRAHLASKGMSNPDAESLIDRDKAEAGGGGQQLEKTLQLADFFVRNAHDNARDIDEPIERFVKLIHGHITTPTILERGMYAGYSAHEKPPFRAHGKPAFRWMGSHDSGPWEASGGCRLSVAVGV